MTQENTELQREMFTKQRTPSKVVLHYADKTRVEYLFHDPVYSIRVLENWIKQIRRFIK